MEKVIAAFLHNSLGKCAIKLYYALFSWGVKIITGGGGGSTSKALSHCRWVAGRTCTQWNEAFSALVELLNRKSKKVAQINMRREYSSEC